MRIATTPTLSDPYRRISLTWKPINMNAGHRQPMTIRCLSHILTTLSVLIIFLPCHVIADVMLYDNLNLGNDLPYPVLGPRPSSNTEDRFTAQQFFTNGNAVVTSTSFIMQRLGSPTGSLHFDIWSDDNGTPGSQLARLGSLDITTLPTTPTTFSFDEPVSLVPNSSYFLVTDAIDMRIPNNNNSFRIGTRTSDEGTFGASRFLVSAPGDEDTWLVLGDLIPHINYLRATITAVSNTPIPGDYDGDGCMDTEDIDALVAEIVAGTNELTFDLTGDEVVNDTDLNQWLSEAASVNGLVDSYLAGDSNLDGAVNATDLNNLALNWRQNTSEWSGGDFTANGVVDSADLNALALNWRQSIPMASAVSAPVPEPSALLLAVIGLALAWRRPSRR